MSNVKKKDQSSYPDPKQVLPHQGVMNYVKSIVEANSSYLECQCPAEKSLLPTNNDGRIPSSVGMEYMSQAAAAYAGLRGHAQGHTPRAGMVLSFREFLDLSEGGFIQGETYLVRVELEHSMGNISMFRGEIFDRNKQTLLLKGRFSVRIGLE